MFDFPVSPTLNQLVTTTDGVTYRWDAAKWKSASVAASYVLRTGDTMTGPLVLSGAPTLPLHAATMAYADTKLTQAAADALYITPAAGDTRWVNVSGDTMNGTLTVADRTIISGASPRLNLYVPGAALNQKYLDLYADGAGTFSMQFVNDAFNAGGAFMSVTRSGTAPQVLTLSAPSINLTGEVTTSSHIYAGAGVFAMSAGQNFGMYGVSGWRYLAIESSQWAWRWEISTGDMFWANPVGIRLCIRTNPDYLIWNQNGPMGGYGSYVVLSDTRAKRDIRRAEVGLAEVLQIEPISFSRIAHEPPEGTKMPDGSDHPKIVFPDEIGFSAQQVRDIIPEAVRVIGLVLPDSSGALGSDQPSLGITETAILAAVINAIKDIDARLRAKEI